MRFSGFCVHALLAGARMRTSWWIKSQCLRDDNRNPTLLDSLGCVVISHNAESRETWGWGSLAAWTYGFIIQSFNLTPSEIDCGTYIVAKKDREAFPLPKHVSALLSTVLIRVRAALAAGNGLGIPNLSRVKVSAHWQHNQNILSLCTFFISSSCCWWMPRQCPWLRDEWRSPWLATASKTKPFGNSGFIWQK